MITNLYMPGFPGMVKRLKFGIFTNCSDLPLRFPTCIIQVLGADESGNLWFRVPNQFEKNSGLESNFYSRIHLYNKKCRYYMLLEGNAMIEDEGTDGVIIRFSTTTGIVNNNKYSSTSPFTVILERILKWIAGFQMDPITEFRSHY